MAINLNILMWVIVESGILWKCGFHISRGELWIHCIDLVSRQRDHYGFRFFMNRENVWYRWATDPTFFIWHTFNPYPWILETNPKRGTITERVSREKKNPERSIEKISICFCALDFFQKTRSVMVRKMAYIFVQHGILPLILAYAIRNLHHSIAQLTLYLYI